MLFPKSDTSTPRVFKYSVNSFSSTKPSPSLSAEFAVETEASLLDTNFFLSSIAAFNSFISFSSSLPVLSLSKNSSTSFTVLFPKSDTSTPRVFKYSVNSFSSTKPSPSLSAEFAVETEASLLDTNFFLSSIAAFNSFISFSSSLPVLSLSKNSSTSFTVLFPKSDTSTPRVFKYSVNSFSSTNPSPSVSAEFTDEVFDTSD